MLTKERLHQISLGYGLPGGGYEFENATETKLAALGAIVWDEPDLDHFGLMGRADLFAFTPYTDRTEWPEYLGHEDPELIYVRKTVGVLYESETECGCWGTPSHDGDWEFSGFHGDPHCPDCLECGGSGRIEQSGGSYALYGLIRLHWYELVSAIEHEASYQLDCDEARANGEPTPARDWGF